MENPEAQYNLRNEQKKKFLCFEQNYKIPTIVFLKFSLQLFLFVYFCFTAVCFKTEVKWGKNWEERQGKAGRGGVL